jgi:hypothetical protein
LFRANFVSDEEVEKVCWLAAQNILVKFIHTLQDLEIIPASSYYAAVITQHFRQEDGRHFSSGALYQALQRPPLGEVQNLLKRICDGK